MTETLLFLVAGLVVIAASTVVGPRLGVASPLLLVAVGVGASFLPSLGSVEIDPELILAGVLPPLLYSSAVSMPAMNFRREFGAISGLSVLLVVASSLLLGLFFSLVLPDLGFAWGVALGAIVSPTDAVATSIVKQTSVSRRVVAMLDGESLLNDATALVLLRTAIVATAASFSFWGALGTFAYSVVVAVVIGLVVGAVNLAVRRRLTDPTVNTVISFAVPFLASVPAGAVGASGLVAAVVAGLVTGIRAPRELSPQSRLSDGQNWRTVELVLEGAVFLTMGLQIRAIVIAVEQDHAGLAPALLIAVGALVLTVLVRAAYVAPLLRVLSARARHAEAMRPRVADMHERISTSEGTHESFTEMNRGRRTPSPRALDQFARRVTQGLADIEYFLAQPLGWRDGTAVVWAGMRGAVTVAAAQTLPDDTPQRPVLVLIAYAVAALSLLVQGGTIGPLLRRIAAPVDEEAVHRQTESERRRLVVLLRDAAAAVPGGEAVRDAARRVGERTEAGADADADDAAAAAAADLDDDARRARIDAAVRHTLAVLAAQRAALLDARDAGTVDAEVLAESLADLDASEIAIRLRGRVPHEPAGGRPGRRGRRGSPGGPESPVRDPEVTD
ncbi:cation:proton antiporter [Frigoribacterium sp. VKM Ac-2530]|uniref:cation:proton antiporter n=1 Tax=Frigoribacterium sp. VKM Ac-2530 TaxID=2783822 RepID=UPI00188AB20E|nr:cation:proton antiporter [Frigoribacterium sp. VKM Ac-2530]